MREIGKFRDWMWRGWQIRYLFKESAHPPNHHQQPPLILIHGFGASIEHWRQNLPVLSQCHRVYALDLLGFGASKKVYTSLTVDLWVQQVYEFWLTFIRQPVILVGNSLGALICLTAAATYPEMVKGLTLLSLPDLSVRQEIMPSSIQPLVSFIERLFTSPILLKPLFKILRRPSVIRRWLGIAYSDKSAITDELVSIIASPPQDDGAARAFCALCEYANQPHFAPSTKAILPELNIPILLIWGKEDRMIPPQLAPKLAALNSQIQLVELAGVGHCPHDESPEKFHAVFFDWFGKLIDNSR